MVLTTLVIFVPHVSVFLTTPIVLIGIIGVIGFLIVASLGIQGKGLLRHLVYSFGSGLSFLIIGGLLLNWLAPLVGIAQPLDKIPLVIFFDSVALILGICIYFFRKGYSFEFERPKLESSSIVFGIIPLVFVLLSVGGSQVLNNGGSNILTLIMLCGVSVYCLFLVLSKRQIEGWVYPWALYCISVALLLMYSLRSAHIIGWDINQEFQVFQATLNHLVWNISYYPHFDYNACISITIVPTILKVLTGMNSEYVFKVLFQLLFAVSPVIVYLLARRYLRENMAFLAAFLLLSQTWFYEQMPALIRQETAFLFYLLIVVVLFEKNLSQRVRYGLFYVFSAALILSHYSTAYIWISLMLCGLVLSYIARFFIKSLRKEAVLITPVMFLITVGFLVAWEIPITHTGSAVANLAVKHDPDVKGIPVQGAQTTTNVVDEKVSTNEVENTIHNAFLKTLFFGDAPFTDADLLKVQQKVITLYGPKGGFDTFTDAAALEYVPHIIDTTSHVEERVPTFVTIMINILTQVCKVLLIDIFPLVGIVVVYLRVRKQSEGNIQDFVFLNAGGYLLIGLMIFVPYLQIYYNFTRLYLQIFLVLSTLAILGGEIMFKRLPRYAPIILASMVVIVFCSSSGLFDQVTGGEARITLNTPPANLDIFYTYDTEVSGAQWLSRNRTSTDPIQADIIASLRLQAFGDISASNFALFPQTIQQNSYIYLSKGNVVSGRGFYQSANNLLVFNYPLDFLNTHKDLIYDNGDSRIYK